MLDDHCQTRMQMLDQEIGEPMHVMLQPNKSIADCQEILALLKEHNQGAADANIVRLYYDAFQISIAHGDPARASVFADRAYKIRITCEGEDSPETRRLKKFSDNPASHINFGASKKWRTGLGMVPKGLDTVGFEEWLWRRSSSSSNSHKSSK